jgi:hypothetical protein
MKRTEGRYNSDYGIVDIYNFYKANQEEKELAVIPLATFRKLLKYHNNEVAKNIVEHSDEYRIPFRLGYLRVRKFKQRLKLDEEGKLKTRHLRANWEATNKLWDENPLAKESKKIIWHINKHTNGYYYKWYWDKRVCNFKNSTVYSLVMSRAHKRAIPQAVKNNENLDYYE